MNRWYAVGSRAFEAAGALWGVDVRSTGHENIPDHGPVVLASNHISYLDFAFVSLAAPRPRRQVRFMARHEFFQQPVLGWLLHKLGTIPVDVHGDALAAARQAEAALRSGQIVGLHPEGTISPSFVPRRAKSGAVRLAEAADAPLLPVAVWGSQRLLTKWQRTRPQRGIVVTVHYGEPFMPEGRTGAAKTRELMARISDLVAEAQRTYPQRAAAAPHDWWVPAHLGGSALTPADAEARLTQQDERRRQQRESSSPPH